MVFLLVLYNYKRKYNVSKKIQIRWSDLIYFLCFIPEYFIDCSNNQPIRRMWNPFRRQDSCICPCWCPIRLEKRKIVEGRERRISLEFLFLIRFDWFSNFTVFWKFTLRLLENRFRTMANVYLRMIFVQNIIFISRRVSFRLISTKYLSTSIKIVGVYYIVFLLKMRVEQLQWKFECFSLLFGNVQNSSWII